MRNNSKFQGLAKRKLAWSVAAAIAISAGVANVASAQEDAAAQLEEITVTGSRIRRDDFSNVQPTTVVGGDMMESLGIVNLGDAMASLPSNVGNNTPTANAGGNFFNGANIANLRGLNPFFGSRTLTLVDSRRHVPTNQGDGVDLNFIPSILIDRMEVVTGGASASYGSGAIGGVTNILLDRNLDGGKVQVDYGTTSENDGDDVHYGLAWGTDLGDSSHFVVAVEGQKMDPILNCATARDWCARGVTIETNSAYATNADPNFVVTTGNRDAYTYGGLFNLQGVKVNAAGTAVEPFAAATAPYSVGGEGRHPYAYTSIRSNVDRQTFYATFTHDFSDNLGMFVEASAGSVETYSPQGSLDLTFSGIAADNFYLSQIANNPCAASPAPCLFSKDFSSQVNTANDTTTDLQRYAFGFNGKFGDSTWTWDAYYQYGESDRDQNVLGNRHAEAFNFAMDAVADASGNAVCRVTRDGMNPASLVDPRIAQGCVPLNVFGTGAIPQNALDYAFGRLLENTVVEQNIVEAVTSGELFSGFGAGPVMAAVGASWRDESIANTADTSQPDYQRTDYLIQYGESFAGDVEVIEYFTEVDVPVTDTFRVVGAVRRSEYTNTGGAGTGRAEGQSFDYGITTWKLNLNWEATEWLTLRGSQSRDIRAPNFRELYYGQVIPSGGPFGYCSNQWTGNISQGAFTNTGDACILDLHGGLSLQPEEADTTTFGFVTTLDEYNLRFAADWYKIEIADAITPANSGLVLDGCFVSKDPALCSQISGTLIDPANPVGGFSDITKVSPEARNFRGYTTSGVDFTADWFAEYDFGTITTRVIASKVIEQTIQPSEATPGLTRDIAGVVGSSNGFLSDWAAAPDWTAQIITSWMKGPYMVTTQGRWVKEGDVYADRFGPQDSNYDPNRINSLSDNALPNYVVWSLNGSYAFNVANTDMSVFATVNNLFNKEPPLSGVGTGGTSPTFYDTVGRNFRIGVRATF